MRIIAGRFKSRLIHSPKGVDLRPTADRVKESLFGILGGFIIDKDALDLFSGTGNLGIEALSRGARSCVFVDSHRPCIAVIKQNLQSLGIQEGVEVKFKDAFKYIGEANAKGIMFDTIFLDPPYYKDLIKKSLLSLDNYNIIKALGIVVAEHYKRDDLPDPGELNKLALFRQEKYGGTILSFYKKVM